jgi:hypothetical protein
MFLAFSKSHTYFSFSCHMEFAFPVWKHVNQYSNWPSLKS